MFWHSSAWLCNLYFQIFPSQKVLWCIFLQTFHLLHWPWSTWPSARINQSQEKCNISRKEMLKKHKGWIIELYSLKIGSHWEFVFIPVWLLFTQYCKDTLFQEYYFASIPVFIFIYSNPFLYLELLPCGLIKHCDPNAGDFVSLFQKWSNQKARTTLHRRNSAFTVFVYKTYHLSLDRVCVLNPDGLHVAFSSQSRMFRQSSNTHTHTWFPVPSATTW